MVGLKLSTLRKDKLQEMPSTEKCTFFYIMKQRIKVLNWVRGGEEMNTSWCSKRPVKTKAEPDLLDVSSTLWDYISQQYVGILKQPKLLQWLQN